MLVTNIISGIKFSFKNCILEWQKVQENAYLSPKYKDKDKDKDKDKMTKRPNMCHIFENDMT